MFQKEPLGSRARGKEQSLLPRMEQKENGQAYGTWERARQLSLCSRTPQISIMRTPQAKFSADVTGLGIRPHVSHYRPWESCCGNLRPALRILSIVFYPPGVINGCYVNVMLLNSQCTFILSNLLLDTDAHIQLSSRSSSRGKHTTRAEGDLRVTIHLPPLLRELGRPVVPKRPCLLLTQGSLTLVS